MYLYMHISYLSVGERVCVKLDELRELALEVIFVSVFV